VREWELKSGGERGAERELCDVKMIKKSENFSLKSK
jgi:hypothetical protein